MFSTIQEITFKISSFCNLNCVYCFQSYDTKTHNEKFSMYDDLVGFMKQLPLDQELEIKLTGGESSLFIDDIRLAYKKIKKVEKTVDTRVFFTTITNGTNLEGIIELMDEGILDAWGCKFSWDGIYSCSKSRLPKNPTFTDDFFNDKIKLLGKSKHADRMLVRMAVTPNTVDHMYESLLFCLDNGCTKWEYYFLSDCDEYRTPEFAERFQKQLSLIADEYNRRKFNYYNWDTMVFTEFVLPKTEMNRLRSIGCRHLGKSLYIANNGDIYPCGYFYPDTNYGDKDFRLGNIQTGFSRKVVNVFSDEYMKTPMCNHDECDNLHCFECPALSKYRTGCMSCKLCQACNLRTIERNVFLDKYKQVNIDKEKIMNTFYYAKEWGVKKDNAKLRWAKDE